MLPVLALAASAAPLSESTAVRHRPNANAAVIGTLEAGAEPIMTTDPLGATPPGWMAVRFAGPIEAFVLNSDLTKTLDVKEGASIRVAPTADAPVLAAMQKGDKVEISGLRGRFTQISLDKSVIGYIRTAVAMPGDTAAAATQSQPPPAGLTPPRENAAPAAAPAPQAAAGGVANRTPSPTTGTVATSGAGEADIPRVFQGKIASTRRLLAPRRPYDYQLNDESGARFAYLDFSRLLQTSHLDSYIDQTVVVQGTAKFVPELNGILISVETLQVK